MSATWKARGTAVHDPLADLRPRVQACVDTVLADQERVLAPLRPEVEDLLDEVTTLMSGGKRLRPGFLYWAYRAGGGPDSPELVRLATSMEFFQAAALLHDDVMDDSDTRRGRPAAHRVLESAHARRRWSGLADRFGLAGAILAGNLCLTWSDTLYAASGLAPEALARARGQFDTMRTQLMGGQFLDVVESMRPWSSVPAQERIDRATRVIHYKSAKYTVEHPVLIGALAAGVGGADLAALSRYGLDLGHAFQLRDDLLGVFGDPAATGKPAGDDLREGKRTVLIAHTLAGLEPVQRARVESMLGSDLDEAGVEELRSLITWSGAIEAVEGEIARLALAARTALGEAGGLDPDGVAVLDALIDSTTAREA